jgi:hypothetical protein
MTDVTSSHTFPQSDQFRLIRLIRSLLISISTLYTLKVLAHHSKKGNFLSSFCVMLRVVGAYWLNIHQRGRSSATRLCLFSITARLSRNVNLLTQSTCQHSHTSAVTILHFLLLANLICVASNIFLLLSSRCNNLKSFLHLTPL